MRASHYVSSWTLVEAGDQELHGRWFLTGLGAAGLMTFGPVASARQLQGDTLLVTLDSGGLVAAVGAPHAGWLEVAGAGGEPVRSQLEALGVDLTRVAWADPPTRGVERDLTWVADPLPGGGWTCFAVERRRSLARFTEATGATPSAARDLACLELRRRCLEGGEDEAARIMAAANRQVPDVR